MSINKYIIIILGFGHVGSSVFRLPGVVERVAGAGRSRAPTTTIAIAPRHVRVVLTNPTLAVAISAERV